MQEKLSLKDLSVRDKKVLMRVDFNVPLTKDGVISDDTRIQESVLSINYILSQGGSIILMSHLGRPEGKIDKRYSLRPCMQRLSEVLKKPIKFANDCIGQEAITLKKNLKQGEILLLENLRFYAAEEHPEKDPSFAKNLAQGCDTFVNDAFGTAHRAHSSTATITQYFPKQSAMGFLMEKELNFLKKNIDSPKRPFFAIIGGSKISSKLGVISSLFSKADKLFIGGGMAFSFLKCLGYEIGNSLVETEKLPQVKNFLDSNHAFLSKIYFPEDIMIGRSLDTKDDPKCVSIREGIPKDFMGLDIGPKTLKSWSKELQGGATYFWNGPIGVFENPLFCQGTFSLAQIISNEPSIKIVGGGDSVSAIHKLGLAHKFSHLSTGGGASLELIEFGHLPGIDALSNK